MESTKPDLLKEETRMLQIMHRKDALLEESSKKFSKESERPSAKNVTLHTHHVLNMFIDERLIKEKFENEREIQRVLSQWPAFARHQNLLLSDIWKELTVNEGVICTVDEGPGGPFLCAIIQHVAKSKAA